MVAKGYKNTEIGVIPEEWEVVNIVDISTMKARIGWQGLTVSEYLKSGDYYLITGTDFSNGKISWDTCHYVNKERYEQDKNIQIKPNDILITKDGTIGKIAFIDNLPLKATLNSGVFVIRPKRENYNSKFIFYLFNSFYFDDFLKKLVAGSTITHLYQKDFIKFNLPFPTFPEQTAIATALSDADALITATEKLIAKKKAIKQGAMQELLKPKEGWVEKTINEIGVVGRGRVINQIEISKSLYGLHPVYSSQTQNEGIMGYIDTYDFEGEYLTWTTDGVYAGKVSHRKGKFNCTNVCGVIKLDNDIPTFVAYLLDTLTPFYVSKNLANPKLMNDVMKKIKISLPKLEEQTRIATILSDLDAEISLLEQKLEKQKQIKQGMMQNLLTGKIRLLGNIEQKTEKPNHNEYINEAVVISFLVNKFGTKIYPLSRFRYTKYAYLLHRQSEKEARGFGKYAAGPYNPANRYKGAENIALKNKYISKVQNPKSKNDAFIVNENIEGAFNYFTEWYGAEIQQWIEQFRFHKNEYLEVLTTVDKAICDLKKENKSISLQTVKELIAADKVWRKKLEKPYFSDIEIKKAIDESNKLFGYG